MLRHRIFLVLALALFLAISAFSSVVLAADAKASTHDPKKTSTHDPKKQAPTLQKKQAPTLQQNRRTRPQTRMLPRRKIRKRKDRTPYPLPTKFTRLSARPVLVSAASKIGGVRSKLEWLKPTVKSKRA